MISALALSFSGTALYFVFNFEEIPSHRYNCTRAYTSTANAGGIRGLLGGFVSTFFHGVALALLPPMAGMQAVTEV